MEEDIKKRLDAQDEALKKIYISAEKTRKYFLWTMIGTLLVFVIPLIGLIFVIPSFISSFTSQFEGIEGL